MDQDGSSDPATAGGHPRLAKTFSTLLAGVVSALPVMLTAWLLIVLYRILRNAGDSIIDGLFRFLNFVRGVKPDAVNAWAFEFPGANFIQALLPVLIVFAVGLAVTNKPGRKALAWVERRLDRLPILGFVYSSFKQLVDALKGLGGERKFKGVAYIEYPSPGCRLLGFVTANYHDAQSGKDVTAVFMPTSPNPLTGFVVIVDDEKVSKCDMTLEQASKLIISAGLVSPMSEGGPRIVSASDLPDADTGHPKV